MTEGVTEGAVDEGDEVGGDEVGGDVVAGAGESAGADGALVGVREGTRLGTMAVGPGNLQNWQTQFLRLVGR